MHGVGLRKEAQWLSHQSNYDPVESPRVTDNFHHKKAVYSILPFESIYKFTHDQ
jgi:hypothetical protein